MNSSDLTQDPVFRSLIEGAFGFARRHLPDPRKPFAATDEQLQRAEAELQTDAADADAKAAVARRILRAIGIPQDKFEAEVARLQRNLAELEERHPDLRKLDEAERFALFYESARGEDWFADGVSRLIDAPPNRVHQALLSGPDDTTPPGIDCETWCLILFGVAIAKTMVEWVVALGKCAGIAIPPLAFVCAVLALVSMISQLLAAQADYKDCVADCGSGG